MKVTVISVLTGVFGTIHKRLIMELENLEIRRQVNPDYNIIKISKNTEKSPGDVRKVDVTQTPNEKPSATPGVSS